MKAIKKMYMGKTINPDFFQRTKDKGKQKKIDEFKKAAKMNIRRINLDPQQGVKLYTLDFLTSFACLRCLVPKKYKNDKLLKLYKKGAELVTKEFNIVDIVTSIRYLNILKKNHLIKDNDEMDFNIRYTKKSLINIDDSEEDAGAEKSAQKYD